MPRRSEELLARGDEVVGPSPHPLGIAHDDEGAVRNEIDEQLHAVGEHRGERFHALDRGAIGELVEDVEELRVLGREVPGPRTDVVGEKELSARRRPETVRRDLERPLVADLEPADLLDRVAPELDTYGVLLGRGEHVEDSAAHGELAALVDEVGARVRRTREPAYEIVQGDLIALPHRHGLEVPESLDDRLQHGPYGCDEDSHRSGGRVLAAGMGETS